MKKNQAVEQEVLETLKLLDRAESIQCRPDFQQRLMARIKALEQDKKRSLNKYLVKPYLIPALCIFFILINITSVLWVMKEDHSEDNYRTTYLTAFAQEYSLNSYNKNLFTDNQ
jgi:hypothetical protein